MRVDIIIENNAYQSYIFDYSISDYDKINMMLTARHNNRHVAWWHVLVDYMKSNKPSMVFKPTDVLTVNFENELLENTFKAYLDGLSGKVKFKTYSNIIPWLSMLQEYWLDTNWNKKKKHTETKKVKKATLSFSGSGSIASGSTLRTRPNTLRASNAPTATVRTAWIEQAVNDASMQPSDDDWLLPAPDEITTPAVPEPLPNDTPNIPINPEHDLYRLTQQIMMEEWRRTWTNTNSGTIGTPGNF